MSLQARYETLMGEGLKTAAEQALHYLGTTAIDRELIETYAFGREGRIEDSRLHTVVAGIEFENPVHVGAGWDKKGRAVHGLYALGFGGVEVGTVLPFPQPGNDKPRLWTINRDHSVGLNRLGFNSIGMDGVEAYLKAAQPLPCPIGLNVGRNKIMDNEMAVWAHDKVIRRLEQYAAYVTLGISSPNTADLRRLQNKGPLLQLLWSAREVTDKPVFIKIDAERTPPELDDMIEAVLETGSAGFVATNTYMGEDLKAKYGERWGNEMGGLSGSDPDYRDKATATVRHIYEQAGDKLAIIGVGGVDSTEAALQKIKAGASAVQIVTAIRPSKGRIAARINRGLVTQMYHEGVTSIQDYIGADTKRGVRVAQP